MTGRGWRHRDDGSETKRRERDETTGSSSDEMTGQDETKTTGSGRDQDRDGTEMTGPGRTQDEGTSQPKGVSQLPWLSFFHPLLLDIFHVGSSSDEQTGPYKFLSYVFLESFQTDWGADHRITFWHWSVLKYVCNEIMHVWLCPGGVCKYFCSDGDCFC